MNPLGKGLAIAGVWGAAAVVMWRVLDMVDQEMVTPWHGLGQFGFLLLIALGMITLIILEEWD